VTFFFLKINKKIERIKFYYYLNVSHTVVVEVGRGGEAFAADWALVRLLTRMNPPVRVERAGR